MNYLMQMIGSTQLKDEIIGQYQYIKQTLDDKMKELLKMLTPQSRSFNQQTLSEITLISAELSEVDLMRAEIMFNEIKTLSKCFKQLDEKTRLSINILAGKIFNQQKNKLKSAIKRISTGKMSLIWKTLKPDLNMRDTWQSICKDHLTKKMNDIFQEILKEKEAKQKQEAALYFHRGSDNNTNTNNNFCSSTNGRAYYYYNENNEQIKESISDVGNIISWNLTTGRFDIIAFADDHTDIESLLHQRNKDRNHKN